MAIASTFATAKVAQLDFLFFAWRAAAQVLASECVTSFPLAAMIRPTYCYPLSRIHRPFTLCIVALFLLTAFQEPPSQDSSLLVLDSILQLPDSSQANNTPAPDSTARKQGIPTSFPRPLPGAIFMIVFFGALGAFASDLLADGGRLDRATSDETGWTLGFWGNLIIGTVAAMVVIALNPPESWFSLVALALSAGLGGEAILLARKNAQKAQKAQQEKQESENKLREVTDSATLRLQALKDNVLRALPAPEANRAQAEHPLNTLLDQEVDAAIQEIKRLRPPKTPC